MNKRLISMLTVLALFVLALGGVYYLLTGGSNDVNNENGSQSQTQANTSSISDSQNKQEGVLPNFSSPTVCTYEIQNEGEEVVESKVYIDGNKYRSEFSSGENDFISVSDGENIYTWMQGSNEGTKMSLDCLSDLQEQTKDSIPQGEGYDFEQYENPKESIKRDNVNADCRGAESVDVSVPENVTFTDQCEVIKNQLESFKNLGDQIPSLEELDIPDFSQ